MIAIQQSVHISVLLKHHWIGKKIIIYEGKKRNFSFSGDGYFFSEKLGKPLKLEQLKTTADDENIFTMSTNSSMISNELDKLMPTIEKLINDKELSKTSILALLSGIRLDLIMLSLEDSKDSREFITHVKKHSVHASGFSVLNFLKILNKEQPHLLNNSSKNTDSIQEFKFEYNLDLKINPVHWIEQHELMDCAAACLAMVSLSFGKYISMTEWRSRIQIGRDGASFLDMSRAANSLGLQTIALKTDLSHLKSFILPCIALVKNHFVVIESITIDQITICDPVKNKYTVPLSEFKEEANGAYLLFKPSEKFFDLEESKSPYLFFRQLLLSSSKQILLATFLTGVGYLALMANPELLRYLINSSSLKEIISLQPFLIVFGVLFGGLISQLFRFLVSEKFSMALEKSLMKSFLAKLFKLPPSYFLNRTIGDTLIRFSELDKIKNVIATFSSSFLVNLISSVLGLIYLAWKAPTYLPWVLAVIPLHLILIRKVLYKSFTMINSIFIELRTASGLAIEQLQNSVLIRNLMAIQTATDQLTQRKANLDVKKLAFTDYMQRYSSYTGLLQESAFIMFYSFGIIFYMKGYSTLGDALANATLVSLCLAPIINLTDGLEEANQLHTSLEKVTEVLYAREEDEFWETEVKFEGNSENIIFNNVSFSYGNEFTPYVLNNISFEILKGQTVLISGPSGSGKSTLAYLLIKYFTPTYGNIYLANTNIKNYKARELRENIQYIGPTPHLFQGTIEHNIKLVSGDSGDADIFNDVLEASQIYDILDTGHTLNTLIQADQPALSTGQQQRICIARALYKRPEIIILDEATSSLDLELEEKVIKGIKHLMKNKIVIIISHRKHMNKHSDQVIIIKDGVKLNT
jgi:ABC-type bacteriocin/lantibiotic exporter with double-glycine peptidase domain